MSEDALPKSATDLPKDLSDLVGALRALAQSHSLLSKGAFAHAYSSAVSSSLMFLENLHQETLSKALNHPDAHLVPELNDLKNKESDEK